MVFVQFFGTFETALFRADDIRPYIHAEGKSWSFSEKSWSKAPIHAIRQIIFVRTHKFAPLNRFEGLTVGADAHIRPNR